MSWRRFLLPVLSVVVLTIVAILPWGLAVDDRFALRLLPVVAIYYWTLDGDAWLPEWMIFLIGLLLDVLTQGPIGYWALIYLVTYVIAIKTSQVRVPEETLVQRLGQAAGAIITVTLFAWIAASIYFLEALNWKPYARGAGIAFLTSAVAIVTTSFFRVSSPPVRLSRGE